MTLRNNGQRSIRPTHPGEMLREDFMPDCGLSVKSLADSLGVSRQTINELIRGKRGLSPDMALRLSRLFGNTPEFWLNAQREVDLWDATQKLKNVIRQIRPLKTA
jgi:antitoxin HigA-1